MKRIFKKTFVPHTSNNPRPVFWHPFSIAFFVGALFLLSGFLATQKVNTVETNLLGDIRTGVLISLTNKERKDSNVPILEENEKLNEAARLKAQDMVAQGYFAHYSPNGISPWFWMNKVGYEYQKAGENLAVNFDDSKDVVDAWMNSPTHKENIIKEGYTQIGIATAKGIYKDKEAIFVVQMFGSPKESSLNQLALSIESKKIISEDSAVQGISITRLDSHTIKDLFQKDEYASLFIMIILLSIVIIAILTILVTWKQHTKKFYISIILLLLALVISVFSIVQFFEEVGIRII